ncbi:MAG: hypothetical protein L0Z50_11425 [Verrucomicrobiales bacterium]|nr:hypothetical protein [Verrucomicrobiales bacterium]
MIAFDSRCPDEAARETFGFVIQPGGALAPGEYAIVEWYCEDSACDCRRAFLQIVPRGKSGPILASINYGWESRAFYRRKMPYDPKAPREITEGSLDPINPQSPLATTVLKIFQQVVAEGEIRARSPGSSSAATRCSKPRCRPKADSHILNPR